jgi:polyribonucleotide nucleotidyltransferase
MLQLFPSLEDLQLLQKDLLLAVEVVKKKLIKQNILNQERRLDGRRLDETRPIMCQVDVIPRVHGSSLFQRGETQVLNILTIGSTRDAQTIDEMEDFEETTKRYMHHYNFPQYSVGAIGKYAGPGRREIGHGALAEKALLPVLPSEEEFPYTMRLVSECLGSNGSTSMASTCASCLSLMAGGVPIKDMVAGVAMGLVLDQASGQFKVLTDIIGEEDFSGDMDFKVAGTKDGITALQLDNKVAGLTVEILKQALNQAKTARLHILNIMQQTISQPRPELSPYAPRVAQLTIPVEKIGEVIGPSGKVIKALIAKTDTEIDIEDLTGRVVIFGKDAELVNYAAEYIKKIVKDYTLGEIVEGVIFRIEPYGAFVKVNGTEKEGLIHISQISDNKIKDIKSLFSIGQKIRAKVIEINDKGQLNLSIKMLNNGNSNQLT